MNREGSIRVVDFKLMKEAAATAKRGEFGDAALLEAASLRDPDPRLLELLRPLRGYAPAVDMSQLQALPVGTFGRVYADFIIDNGIQPLEFSDAMLERFEDNPFIVRSTATHDMLHVLTGFDAGLAGEAGVYAFSVAQETSTGGPGILWMLRILYSLASPTQIGLVHNNAKVGLRMGANAKTVLTEPLEDYFDEPLEDVRARLDIPQPVEAGARPSRSSIVAKLVFNKVLPSPVAPTPLQSSDS